MLYFCFNLFNVFINIFATHGASYCTAHMDRVLKKPNTSITEIWMATIVHEVTETSMMRCAVRLSTRHRETHIRSILEDQQLIFNHLEPMQGRRFCPYEISGYFKDNNGFEEFYYNYKTDSNILPNSILIYRLDNKEKATQDS